VPPTSRRIYYTSSYYTIYIDNTITRVGPLVRSFSIRFNFYYNTSNRLLSLLLFTSLIKLGRLKGISIGLFFPRIYFTIKLYSTRLIAI